MKKSYYQMVAYTLIAVGLINLDYQRSKSGILIQSSISVLSGVLLVVATFQKNFQAQLAKRVVAYPIMLGAIAALILQLI